MLCLKILLRSASKIGHNNSNDTFQNNLQTIQNQKPMLKLYREKYIALIMILCAIAFTSCKEKKAEEPEVKEVTTEDKLREALTFYASFDKGVNADFALGDSLLYSVPNRKARDSAQAGLHKPNVSLEAGKGKFGHGLYFAERSKGTIYYPSAGNLAYSKENWNGAISFWLSVDPNTELAKGYCDPIQITDVNYNDASIWVDFTDDDPRIFRLGVIGDLNIWNPENLKEAEELFTPQVAPVENPAFASGKWTHVLINYTGLNTKNGEASLYLDGELKGAVSNISLPFTWDLDQSNIYLGLGYIGLMDELSIFNKNLSAAEIKALYTLENGVQTVLD